jgi:hypothetical protein
VYATAHLTAHPSLILPRANVSYVADFAYFTYFTYLQVAYFTYFTTYLQVAIAVPFTLGFEKLYLKGASCLLQLDAEERARVPPVLLVVHTPTHALICMCMYTRRGGLHVRFLAG